MSNNIQVTNDILELLNQRESIWNNFDKVKNDISELKKYCDNCDWTDTKPEFPQLKYVGMPSDLIPVYKKLDEYGGAIATNQQAIHKSMTDIQQYEKDLNDIKQTKTLIIVGIVILLLVGMIVVALYS